AASLPQSGARLSGPAEKLGLECLHMLLAEADESRGQPGIFEDFVAFFVMRHNATTLDIREAGLDFIKRGCDQVTDKRIPRLQRIKLLKRRQMCFVLLRQGNGVALRCQSTTGMLIPVTNQFSDLHKLLSRRQTFIPGLLRKVRTLPLESSQYE